MTLLLQTDRTVRLPSSATSGPLRESDGSERLRQADSDLKTQWVMTMMLDDEGFSESLGGWETGETVMRGSNCEGWGRAQMTNRTCVTLG